MRLGRYRYERSAVSVSRDRRFFIIRSGRSPPEQEFRPTRKRNCDDLLVVQRRSSKQKYLD